MLRFVCRTSTLRLLVCVLVLILFFSLYFESISLVLMASPAEQQLGLNKQDRLARCGNEACPKSHLRRPNLPPVRFDFFGRRATETHTPTLGLQPPLPFSFLSKHQRIPPRLRHRTTSAFSSILLFFLFFLSSSGDSSHHIIASHPSIRKTGTNETIAGWLIWRRWVGLERQGLHPFFRTIGFSVILAAALALLPFNSTVREADKPEDSDRGKYRCA